MSQLWRKRRSSALVCLLFLFLGYEEVRVRVQVVAHARGVQLLSGARARDVRCYFVCESRELTQKVVQVARDRLDDDSIDTSFAVVLYFVEDCVGLRLEGWFQG